MLSTNDNSLIGQTIDGRFYITRHLGTGGMGTAYEAIETDLERHVCLKFLKSDALSSLDSFNRFKREARVLASLQHKNIVECYSFGVYKNVYPYLALEYIEGLPLNVLAQQKTLHWVKIVRLVIQVCDALEYAHNRGFIHRDIKPANVMVTRGADGEDIVKVVDFGLVGKQKGAFAFETLTDPQSIIGSVNYMPPEAFKGSTADISLDVYALGCLLYEMLSGQLPFAADNPIAVMFKHTQERLPELPVSLKPDLARHELNHLIQRSTEPSQAKRIMSCAEIRKQLFSILELESTTTEFTSIKASDKPDLVQRKMWLLPLAVSAVTVVLIAVALQTKSGTAPKVHFGQGGKNFNRETSTTTKISPDIALKQFQDAVNSLNAAASSPSEIRKARSSFRNFLERYASALHSEQPEVLQLTQAASSKLAKMQEYATDKDLQMQLFADRCDLLTSLGYYQNTLELLKAGANHGTQKMALQSGAGDQRKLAQLDDHVFESNNNLPDRFAVERLRPAAARYAYFRDDGIRLMRMVKQLNTLEVEDHSAPRLVELAGNLSRNRDDRLIEFWIILCEIAIRSHEPELAQVLIPRIRKEMVRYPAQFVERVANLYDRLGQTKDALKIVKDGSEVARRRGDNYFWCICKLSEIEILSRRGQKTQAQQMLRQVLDSKYWTPRAGENKTAERFDLIYRYSKTASALQDYSCVIQLYKQASACPAQQYFRERFSEMFASCQEAYYRLHDDSQAELAFENTLEQVSATEKILLLTELCEAACRIIDDDQLQINLLSIWSAALTDKLGTSPQIAPETSARAQSTLLAAKAKLADALVARKKYRKAADIYQKILRLEYGPITSQNRCGWWFSLLHTNRMLGEIEGCRTAATKLMGLFNATADWHTLEYGIFSSTIAEYLLAEALLGDLRKARALLDTQLEKFKGVSILQGYLKAVKAQCLLWEPVQRADIALLLLAQSQETLNSLPPPDAEQLDFYLTQKRLIAQLYADVGDYSQATKLFEQLLQEYPTNWQLIDCYCSLALYAYERGDDDGALAQLERASKIHAQKLESAIRTNFTWAKALASKHKFEEAKGKLDQLYKLLDTEKDQEHKQATLIELECAYDKLYSSSGMPDEGEKHLRRAFNLVDAACKSGNVHLTFDLIGKLLVKLSSKAEKRKDVARAIQFLYNLKDPRYRTLWQRNTSDYANGPSSYLIGKLYCRINQRRKALAYLREAVKYIPADNYKLLLAEVESTDGEAAAAARNYRAELDRAQQIASIDNDVQNLERGRIYLSYACWLHDSNRPADANRYAQQALSLIDNNPGIHRPVYGNGQIATESDTLLRNLVRLQQWYSADRLTLQRLITAVSSANEY